MFRWLKRLFRREPAWEHPQKNPAHMKITSAPRYSGNTVSRREKRNESWGGNGDDITSGIAAAASVPDYTPAYPTSYSAPSADHGSSFGGYGGGSSDGGGASGSWGGGCDSGSSSSGSSSSGGDSGGSSGGGGCD